MNIVDFVTSQDGKLEKGDYMEIEKVGFDLRTWNHESGYWLIFKNGVRAFTKGTPLETMDMKKVYYFRYAKLKKLAKEHL